MLGPIRDCLQVLAWEKGGHHPTPTRSCLRRHVPPLAWTVRLLWALAFLLAAACLLQAQQLTGNQQKAVKALMGFFKEFGETGESESIREDFQNGRIRIGPVEENDNADTNADTGTITLNTKMVGEILQGSGESFKDTADWAATIRHEKVHASQGVTSIFFSNMRYTLFRGECPHEVAGWRAGFQSFYDWMQQVRRKMAGASGESEREAVARQLRDLAKDFQTYRQEYVNHKPRPYGPMTLSNADGMTVTLDAALTEVNEIKKKADDILERTDFTVKTSAHVLNLKKGDPFTVQAVRYGGAFADPKKANDKDENFTYVWTVNNMQVGSGRVITQTAKDSEKLTVTVTDKQGRKRSASCEVKLAAKAAPPASQPAQTDGDLQKCTVEGPWGSDNVSFFRDGKPIVQQLVIYNPSFGVVVPLAPGHYVMKVVWIELNTLIREKRQGVYTAEVDVVKGGTNHFKYKHEGNVKVSYWDK